MLDQPPPLPAGEFTLPPSPPQTVRHAPQFSGRAGEFFGIWFVNLVLSILTLGIYSAWAKVRTERYFYGNTRLAGSSFEYLASPISILKGRLIAYAVVIALSLSAKFAIGLYFLLLLGVFAIMPMLVVWSLRFRARNSAWRGLTFHFDRTAVSGYGPFLGWPVLSSITLSILYPLMVLRQQEFVAYGHRFGRRAFGFRGDLGPYYGPYGIALLFGVLLYAGFFAVMIASFAGAGAGSKPSPELGGAMFAAIIALYIGFFAIGIFLRVRYANLFWNNTFLGEHRFESTLRVRDMLWIYGSNLVAIVCTIGLAVPWAMIRLAHYRAEHFAVLTQGSIEDFLADAEGQRSATGAEMVDALDIGVDIGI